MIIIKILSILLFILSSIHSIAFAQEDYKVRSIEFSGNNAFSAGVILKQVNMYGTGRFRELILRKEPFRYNREIVNADLERIANFYRREGYLDVRVELDDVKADHANETVRLLVAIDEGKPVTVKSVDFNLRSEPEGISPARGVLDEHLRGKLSLAAGVRFRDAAARADQTLISDRFSDSGYPYITIKPRLNVDDDNHEVRIIWQIDPGPRCFFGEVEIDGNRYISDRTIRRHVAFDKGDLYNKSLVDKTQRQVYELGMFHIVSVKSLLSADKTNIVPVLVKIREAPRLSTKFGVGYGREDNIRLFSDTKILSVFGGARRANLNLKHSGLEPYRIDLKLTQPSFITLRTTLVINPFIRRQKEPGYKVNRLGNDLKINHQMTGHIRSSAVYSFERVTLDLGSVARDPRATGTGNDLYNKSSLTLGLTRDESTPLFSPEKGTFSAITIKYSGLGMGSDYHFTKLLLDLRAYREFPGIVLALRVKTGGIESHDRDKYVPVEDRFYAGGASSVRGWARAMLGPLDENDVPIGGKSLLEGSVEFRYPIIGPLSGVVFLDYGNVWIESFSFHLDDLRYAAGAGLRYSTPIGPVRLDAGRPVFEEESKFQFHISVGQAF